MTRTKQSARKETAPPPSGGEFFNDADGTGDDGPVVTGKRSRKKTVRFLDEAPAAEAEEKAAKKKTRVQKEEGPARQAAFAAGGPHGAAVAGAPGMEQPGAEEGAVAGDGQLLDTAAGSKPPPKKIQKPADVIEILMASYSKKVQSWFYNKTYYNKKKEKEEKGKAEDETPGEQKSKCSQKAAGRASTNKTMISSHTLLLGILQGLIAVAQSRLGGSAHQHRMLGRWTFEEPCIAGPVLYENPAEGSSLYDESLRQYHRINARLYEDEGFTKPLSVYSDMICDVLARNHTICSYYMIDDTAGVFSLFSGIAKLDFSGAEDESPRSKSRNSRGSQEKQVVKPVGTGRFVYQGGSDLHAGVLGRVSTLMGQASSCTTSGPGFHLRSPRSSTLRCK